MRASESIAYHAVRVALDLLLQHLQTRTLDRVVPVAVGRAVPDELLERDVVVGGAAVQRAAAAEGGRGHGSGGGGQLAEDGGVVAVDAAPCETTSCWVEGAGGVGVEAAGISPRGGDGEGGGAARRELAMLVVHEGAWQRVVEAALLGQQRGWVRYRGAEAGGGSVAQVVSRGEFSQGSRA